MFVEEEPPEKDTNGKKKEFPKQLLKYTVSAYFPVDHKHQISDAKGCIDCPLSVVKTLQRLSRVPLEAAPAYSEKKGE